MAQRVDIKHAIFDTFNYQHGAEPVFDRESTNNGELDLESFLQHGDGVLNRDAGYFFGPVKNKFVVAFESQRTDDLSRKQTMYYFDVFWASFDSIRDIHLADLIKQLHKLKAESFKSDISLQVDVNLSTYSDYIPRKGEIPDIDRQQNDDDSQTGGLQDQSQNEFVDASELDVNAEQSDPGSGSSGFESVDTVGPANERNNSQETKDSNNTESRHRPDSKKEHTINEPEAAFIAQFWEQWRRSNEQLESKIADIDRFNYAVSDAHRHLTFVSTERKINKTFDVIGGEFEYTLDTRDLEERITTLQDDQNLYWDHLPTYSDELQAMETQSYEYLKENDFFSNGVEAFTDDIETEIESSIDAVKEHSAETFRKAYAADWDDDDSDSSLIGGVSNVVGRSNNRNDPEYVSQLSADTISDDEIDQIVDELVHEEIEGSLKAERERIIQQVDRRITQLEKEIREQLTKGVIRNVDRIKSSEVYERAAKEEDTRN